PPPAHRLPDDLVSHRARIVDRAAMGWHARLRCGAAWVAVALLSPLALAQPPDAAPPAAEITAESLPELTAAPTETATRRPTRLPTATASNTTTETVTETATPGRPTATAPP